MRTMNVALLTIFLSVALSLSCAGQDPALPAVFGDGADARYDRVDNVHQVRFVEIFLVGREAGTGDFVAAVYNTMYTPQGIPKSKDTSPQALLEGIDFDQVQKQYGVLGASLNGPKLCLPDWVEIDVGAERDFDGLAAVWCAQLNMGNNASVGEIATYTPVTIAREQWVGLEQGHDRDSPGRC
jgi:hypothetical protein